MINYVAPMVINYMEFSSMLEGDLRKLIEELETIRKELKKVSGYTYDNSHFRFSDICGTEFSFQIRERSRWDDKERKFNGIGVFDLSVWDYSGGTSIFEGVIPENNRKEFIKKVMGFADRWTRGEKQCDGCGKWISYKENQSHRYFAGIYCTECWENKWKDIEERENYE